MSDEATKLVDNNSSKTSQKAPSVSKATPAEQQARKEADVYFKQAEGHLKASSGFFGLFSSGPNYYDAIDCYQRAGNILKEAKLCKQVLLEAFSIYFR